QLSSQFDFIRVDLYIVGDEVYFGELTNFPAAGWDAIEPTWLDFKLGTMVNLVGSGHHCRCSKCTEDEIERHCVAPSTDSLGFKLA
ncbi:MAG: hypothetical protein IPK58_25180, partial [Acidobacteria bacterium]|nr:hypothetical protein [Acidobacteriota bacterium]